MEINASAFKAQCLKILDEVAATGEPVLILKHGKPVARLVPPYETSGGLPQHELAGTVTLHDDCIEPAVPAEAWHAEKGKIV